MNELQIFTNNEFGKVRVINIEGKPYAVGKDIALALGYADPSGAIRKHCKNIRKEMLQAHGQNGNVVKTQTSLIPEGDIYRLIVRSKLPSAEKFEKWVFDEVLPQIRQTGGYIPINEDEDDATIMAKALLIAQKTIEKKDKLITELQPKANWFDSFINSEGLYSSTQVAKILHISSAMKLNRMLYDEGIIYKRGKCWFPYVDTDNTWYKMIVGGNENYSYSQLKFTPKGLYGISKLLDISFGEEDLNLA